MSQQPNDQNDDFGDHGEYGARGRGALRMRQMRLDAQAQLAEAQRMMARATVRSVRYMLWAVIACTAASVITAAAVLYGLLAVLPRLSH
jgi:hypothetical protein